MPDVAELLSVYVKTHPKAKKIEEPVGEKEAKLRK